MHSKKNVILQFCRICIMFTIVVTGTICAFTLPKQGLNICGSALMIALAYFCVLYRPRGQWIELLVLFSVLGMTAYSYAFPNTLNGLLFLAQLIYLFYGVGKLLVFKEFKKAYQDRPWPHKAKK